MTYRHGVVMFERSGTRCARGWRLQV